MNVDQVVASLVQKVERSFYGKYRGVVVDNADPEKLGRLKVKVPSVLGSDVVTGWATPCVPYGGAANQGFLFIPEVDAGVWVEFEEGDLEFPIWVGTYWTKPGGDSELTKPNDSDGTEQGDVQDPPTRKIIKTLKGHTIQFEDKDDEEMVTIVAMMDDEHRHVLTMDGEGIKVTDGVNEHVITMNADGVTITDGKNSNTVTLDNSGIVIEDKNGNVITMDSSSVTIKGSSIKIGDGASEPLVLGNQLKTALDNWINTTYMTHMHTGNLGAPTTPPLPGAPLLLDPALSQTNKVK
ncbi:MAG TPA: phage baseplate assembly protein V [Nitrospira sp.]|nr:phage baseplate assembly protein V [Nitrospira sp.]